MRIADIQWTDLTLTPADTLRGEVQDEVAGVISLGKPFVVDAAALALASQKELDPEINLFMPTHIFPYIRFAVSIRPGNKHDVRFVALDVELESPNNEAICWSMQPVRVEQEIKARIESKLSSKLKLEIAEIGSEGSIGSEYVIYQPEVEAFNLYKVNPAWELRAVEGRKLSGIQILHMIVRMPKDSNALSRVTLRADIFRKGFLWSYRVRRSDQSEEIFSTLLP